jgi:hypothetical protein
MPRPAKSRSSADLAPKKKRAAVPFPFVVEALAPLNPEVRPMFGCHSVYVGDKAVFMLRDKPASPADNGLWIIFEDGFDASSAPEALRHQFPSLRPIRLLEGKIKHWLVLPSDAPDFESSALHACDLALASDPRLGRVPASRKSSRPRKR